MNKEDKIQYVLNSFFKAYGDKDIDKLLSCFADGFKLIMSFAETQIVDNPEDIKSAFMGQFGRGENLIFNADILSMSASDDEAKVTFKYKMTFNDIDDNDDRVVATGKCPVKLKKVGDNWKIIELEQSISTWDKI